MDVLQCIFCLPFAVHCFFDCGQGIWLKLRMILTGDTSGGRG